MGWPSSLLKTIYNEFCRPLACNYTTCISPLEIDLLVPEIGVQTAATTIPTVVKATLSFYVQLCKLSLSSSVVITWRIKQTDLYHTI